MWILRLMLLLVVSSAVQAEPLRVVCWNIHHGVGEDGRLDLRRIAKVIKAEKPDLVALQEVDNHCRRSGQVDQAAELGRLLEMEPVFGKAMDFGGGGYGLAILSRWPIHSHQVHRLPGEGEPRIGLEVRVKHPTGELSFISVHLDHTSEGTRIRQAAALAAKLEPRKHAILCGDFNAEPSSKPMKALSAWSPVAKSGQAFTQPAGKPKSEIDHVLLRGFVSKGGVRVVRGEAASDHCLLTLDVTRAPVQGFPGIE